MSPDEKLRSIAKYRMGLLSSEVADLIEAADLITSLRTSLAAAEARAEKAESDAAAETERCAKIVDLYAQTPVIKTIACAIRARIAK